MRGIIPRDAPVGGEEKAISVEVVAGVLSPITALLQFALANLVAIQIQMLAARFAVPLFSSTNLHMEVAFSLTP
jgi:hypothetical protein